MRIFFALAFPTKLGWALTYKIRVISDGTTGTIGSFFNDQDQKAPSADNATYDDKPTPAGLITVI